MKEYYRYGGVSSMYCCSYCQKKFLVPFQSKGGGKTQWVYRRRNRKTKKKDYFCSYHCFKAAEEVVNQ